MSEVLIACFYLVSVIFAEIMMQDDFENAFWWPIHLAKALLKSFYRAMFTGWTS